MLKHSLQRAKASSRDRGAPFDRLIQTETAASLLPVDRKALRRSNSRVRHKRSPSASAAAAAAAGDAAAPAGDAAAAAAAALNPLDTSSLSRTAGGAESNRNNDSGD